MSRLRGTWLALAVAAGGVLLPAERSEAALFDCFRRIFCRPACDPCGTPVVGCPEPVVVEGSYCAPCPTTVCSTSYVRRSYLEPRTCYTTQCALEAHPVYVRRSYWDPCFCGYRTYLEPATSYVRRCYSVPVTNYVQRSYLEPVTSCTTPSCAPAACPTGGCATVPATVVPPAVEMPVTPPVTTEGRRNQPVVRGPVVPAPRGQVPARTAAPAKVPQSRDVFGPVNNSARRELPVAASAQKFATY